MQQDYGTESNKISIMGKIVSDYCFSHEVFGEGFYTFSVEVPRLSDASDMLPVTISERIMDAKRMKKGEYVYINGQIRSYNQYDEKENRNRLVLTIFAKDCEIAQPQDTRNPNDVCLNGFICKLPIYRTTPFGREIADLLIAVNRSYNKSDYIPCITWGRNARFAGKLAIGDPIKLWGRMQSRAYQKKIEEGVFIEKTAYELSVSKLELGISVENTKENEEENEGKAKL